MPHLPRRSSQSHNRKRKQRKRQPGNAGPNAKFYNSQLWRRTSATRRKLANARPHGIGCLACLYVGGLGSAQVCDHIVPISEGGARFDERNLMELCHSHHNKKRGMEAHGYRNKIRTKRTDKGLVAISKKEAVEVLTRGEGVVNL